MFKLRSNDAKLRRATNFAKATKSVDYKGGKVFFCCDNCPKGFSAKIKAGDEQFEVHLLIYPGKSGIRNQKSRIKNPVHA